MPWYVYLFGGWSIGVLFPWYLVCSQFYCRARRKTAIFLAAANVLLFALFCAAAFLLKCPWDTLLLVVVLLTVVWSALAWLVQRLAFGAAPRRYYPGEWRSWIAPIGIAVFLGIGLSVAIGAVPMIGERLEMYRSPDLLARKVILWDFFHFIPYSLLFSLPIGIWWAGERNRFSAVHPLGYFFGLVVSSAFLAAMSGLFYFLLWRGQLGGADNAWPVMPELQGVKKNLYFLLAHDYSYYFAVPLLLGAVGRMSEFWKKSLAIFPVLTITLLLISPFSPEHWQAYQSQIIYEMASEDPARRAKANDRAEVLLARFPEHDGWPEIARRLAGYRALQGDDKAAQQLWAEVVERTKDSPRWHRQAALAKAALNPGSAAEEQPVAMSIPSLHYKSYMTGNWMALLRNLRFYEGRTGSEADTLIRLKDISADDEKIKLQAMPTLAELDDHAAALGYQTLLLPSELSVVKKLLTSGFPVIQPVKHSFYLLSGIDGGRATVTGANYDRIPEGLKKEDKEGVAAGQPLFADKDSSADDALLSRIDILAEAELPFSFWQEPRQSDHAASMAVVFPPQFRQQVVTVLGGEERLLQQGSTATLTALAAQAALNCGDAIQAITWAQRSYELGGDPFPLRTAHLADLLWQSRKNRTAHALHLERHFPRLEDVGRFLAEPRIQAFLTLAGAQFERDFADGRLDWMTRSQYRDFLDISNVRERQRLIAVTEHDLRLEPDSRKDWLFLAGLFEWEKDLGKIAAAYRGALEADTWSDSLAVKLAYLLVRDGRHSEAEQLLARIKEDEVKYQPDYYYSLAAVADWNKDFAGAAGNYEKAIDMRRYDSHYHLDYARMLDRLGEGDRARRLERWGSRLLIASPAADPGDRPADRLSDVQQ
jgi:hypothetical protein